MRMPPRARARRCGRRSRNRRTEEMPMGQHHAGQDETITIKGAPEPRGPYVHARRHEALVYVTAQIGRDPKTGDCVKGGFEAGFNQAIDHVAPILKASAS